MIKHINQKTPNGKSTTDKQIKTKKQQEQKQKHNKTIKNIKQIHKTSTYRTI